MSRPKPTRVFHFTRIEHLSTIVESGLHCDARAKESGVLAIEVGDTQIKSRRGRRPVPVKPGGVVADYVPFYFAAQSPMMSSIAHGNVPGYNGGTAEIVYLVTTVERLQELGLDVLVTDRNAVLRLAEFARLADGEPSDDFVDWPLMREQYWFNTDAYPDRKERRMAECLVHGSVPWSAFGNVVAKNEEVAATARRILAGRGVPQNVDVRPNWYF